MDACGVDGVASAVSRLRGQSHVSWRVEREGLPPVALRIEPRRGILPPYDLASEARLMRRLAAAGILVPTVLGETDALTPTADTAAACLVLEWVDGEPLNAGPVDAVRAALYCDALRRVHRLDWRAAGLDWMPIAESGAALRERAEIRARLHALGLEDVPHIRRLREMLEGRLPEEPPPMPVHGDVNFGNVVLRPDGSAVMLDWEQAHLGDPLSDWGRLAAEDLLGNLDLTGEARAVMRQALARYGRSDADLHYWTLHQLYKHASATGALTVLRDWDQERIAAMYEKPTERLASADAIWP